MNQPHKSKKELRSRLRASEIFGYNQDSFYRFKKLYEEHREDGLQEMSRKKPNLKNRVPIGIEEGVIQFAIDGGQPADSKGTICKLYDRKNPLVAADLLNRWGDSVF